MFGQSHLGDTGQGAVAGGCAGPTTAKCAAATASACKGPIVKAIRNRACSRSRRCANQGVLFLRVLHRSWSNRSWPAWSAAPTSQPAGQDQTAVRLHRSHPRGSARGDPPPQAAHSTARPTPSSSGARRMAAPPAGPAIQLILSTWPHGAVDDPQSRFINERAHANIQKDGTYSVVPRMWVGERNHRCRTAAHRRRGRPNYDPDGQRVTGGQRIDLLGVKKADLPHCLGRPRHADRSCLGKPPAHWSDLRGFGMVPLRYPGLDLHGQAELEHDLFGMWSPHRVKLAISRLPAQLRRGRRQDIGVIGGIPAGNLCRAAMAASGDRGGAVPRPKVATRAEVLEYSGAFPQLYREERRVIWTARSTGYRPRRNGPRQKKRVVDDATAGRR